MAENDAAVNGPTAVEPVVTNGTAAVLPEKKVPRYYNPLCVQSSVKSKSYASSVVSSQSMMLENLRYMRRQLEKEDRELERIQKDLYLNQYPGKWTNYRHQTEKEEDV